MIRAAHIPGGHFGSLRGNVICHLTLTHHLTALREYYYIGLFPQRQLSDKNQAVILPGICSTSLVICLSWNNVGRSTSNAVDVVAGRMLLFSTTFYPFFFPLRSFIHQEFCSPCTGEPPHVYVTRAGQIRVCQSFPWNETGVSALTERITQRLLLCCISG